MAISLKKIAGVAGLKDSNVTNLVNTIEGSILAPLKDYGYIESYEKQDGLDGIKYVITRKTTPALQKEDVGSVKKDAGSVKRNRI